MQRWNQYVLQRSHDAADQDQPRSNDACDIRNVVKNDNLDEVGKNYLLCPDDSTNGRIHELVGRSRGQGCQGSNAGQDEHLPAPIQGELEVFKEQSGFGLVESGVDEALQQAYEATPEDKYIGIDVLEGVTGYIIKAMGQGRQQGHDVPEITVLGPEHVGVLEDERGLDHQDHA